ncbi:uncharacterized protein LOC120188245 [Hibiscus syriacus]|uniref:uncharacterized protein LOC120188245 n=1 Tax=Hibiscus syriacus TaxID=106335 RepID=UPI001922F7D6|nr:uncharacterized protein LOC120188245 [Hibiscus syriacus]
MTLRYAGGPLEPFGHEIERSFKQRRRNQRAREYMNRLQYQGDNNMGDQADPDVMENNLPREEARPRRSNKMGDVKATSANDKFGGKQPENSIQDTTQHGDKAQIVELKGLPEEKEKDEVSESRQKYNEEIQFKKFVDVLDQLYINVPLLEAIEQMCSYAKFLKDIVTKKRKVEKIENVTTMKELCSALSKLPPKQKDPDIIVISCSIADKFMGRAVVDLGSNINLMPKSIFLKLEMCNACPTTIILQLDVWSYVRPKGRIEDVIVKMERFVFPVDFLILDCEADENAPIILGWAFLATGRILIDSKKGEFTMRVGYQCVTINVFNSMKHVDD